MPPIPFDIVGFDLDGTLFETSGDLAAAVNHAIGTIGLAPFEPIEVRPFVGRGARVMLQRALAAREREEPGLVDALLPLLLDFYADNLARHTHPYAGAVAAMDALRAEGVRLAICTNKAARFTEPLIAQLGMRDAFAAIVSGDSAGVQKPDPAPLHLMIEQAGGGRCLFVGDTVNDIEAARRAGVPSVAVTFGYCEGSAHDLGAGAVIDHFDELVPLVRGWPA